MPQLSSLIRPPVPGTDPDPARHRAARPTVLLADPIPIVREGIRAMLGGASGFRCLELPGPDGKSSLLPADAILLYGMAASLREAEAGLIGLRAVLPALRILLFVDPRDPVPHPSVLQRLGVVDCLPRTADREQLLGTLKRLADAGLPACPPAHTCRSTAAGPKAGVERLTRREREVLACMCRGRDNAGIAKGLGLTRGTVKVYVSRILGKLGASDRTQAVLIALFGTLDGPAASARGNSAMRCR
jgi:DNA-binding NarL/FixJ family response regulator